VDRQHLQSSTEIKAHIEEIKRSQYEMGRIDLQIEISNKISKQNSKNSSGPRHPDIDELLERGFQKLTKDTKNVTPGALMLILQRCDEDDVNSRPNGASESRRSGAGSECRFCGLGRVAF
jgi:hypothetical protein